MSRSLARTLAGRAREEPALVASLSTLLEQARASWPTVTLEAERFWAFVTERLGDRDPLDALRELRLSDLYLACAVADGNAPAREVFDRTFQPKVADVVARVDSSPAFVDEVQQRLREHLFWASNDRRPRIAEYGGQGSLSNWVRATALRLALNAKRAGRKEVLTDDDELEGLSPTAPDLELDLIKARYRDEFKQAFGAALAELSSQERNVLRLNFLDGLNIEQIGTLYQVHRATVARWIARARRQLLGQTRKLLAAKLKLSRPELDSLMGLVRSQLDVSINRFLKDG